MGDHVGTQWPLRRLDPARGYKPLDAGNGLVAASVSAGDAPLPLLTQWWLLENTGEEAVTWSYHRRQLPIWRGRACPSSPRAGVIPLPEVEVEVFDDGRRSRWRASAPARRGHWELSSGHGLELVRDDLLGAPPPLTGPGSH